MEGFGRETQGVLSRGAQIIFLEVNVTKKKKKERVTAIEFGKK